MIKKAFRYSTERIIEEELPVLQTKDQAQIYVNRLNADWEAQTINNVSYAVDIKSWDTVMNAIQSKFKVIKIPSWFESKAHDTYQSFPTRRDA